MTSTKQSSTLLPVTVPANTTTTSTTTAFVTFYNTTTTTPLITTQMRTTPTTTTTTTTTTNTTTTMAPTTASTTTTTTTTTPAPTSAATEPARVITETEYEVHNFPPKQDRRLKKIPVTAGKPLSYVIPANTFSDVEEGDTRNLRLSLYLQGAPLKPTHWLQFNQRTQEVYGL